MPDLPHAQISPADPDPGSIHGVVESADGAVYQGVRIVLESVPAKEPARTAASDSDGQFSFSGVPPGAFQLTVSSEGFTTRTISGVLHQGETYDAPPIVLVVNTASSEVRVSASQVEIAQEQLHIEMQQRVLGVIPNFYVAYPSDTLPLTSRQKFQLAWRSSIDPFTIALSGAIAGVEQANNSFSGYGQGAQGYAKRFGANYADNTIGTFLGGAILPSLLKQDPRYYYKGTGTVRSRVLYAIANSVICKSDSGHWQPAYSAILGGLAAGGISNLYYPATNREGFTLTLQETLIGTAETAAANLFQEFIVRRFTPRLPPHNPGDVSVLK